MNEVYRGDIFYGKFPKPQGKSSVQGGTRPVLILQNDIGNRYASTVIVMYIFSSRNNIHVIFVSILQANLCICITL